jgi:hypothetical protein
VPFIIDLNFEQLDFFLIFMINTTITAINTAAITAKAIVEPSSA